MRIALFSLILFTISLAQMPFASACAQEKGEPFIVRIPAGGRGMIPMAFRIDNGNQSVAVGYEEYNHPAVPIDTKGEVFIPDSITTPDGRRLKVRWLSRGSFQGCEEVTEIRMARTIESISDLAFQGCKSLREITLPDSLRVIYPQAFAGCCALRRIVLHSPYPPTTYLQDVFEENLFSTTTIVLPYGSTDNYRKDHLFSRFRYHMELTPSYPHSNHE